MIGKLGNFVNRVLVFAKNNTEGKVPEKGPFNTLDEQFALDIKKYADEIKSSYENFRLRRAAGALMELAQKGNVYFDQKKPWLAVKDPNDIHSMRTTINLCVDAIKTIALTSFPIIPETASKIWQMLGLKGTIDQSTWENINSMEMTPGHCLGEPVILFRKIEDAEIESEINTLKSLAAKNAPAKPINAKVEEKKEKETIAFDLFQKVDLRVGLVKHAEKLEKSKKLLKLTVDIGTEERTIVSGIALVATPEEMIGKKVVVVVNLAPQKIMGVESQGMILCGGGPESPEIITLNSSTPGTEVR